MLPGSMFLFAFCAMLVHGVDLAGDEPLCEPDVYNDTYPFTPPVVYQQESVKYKLAVIADMDKKARENKADVWTSKLKTGWLTSDLAGSKFDVEWDDEITLKGQFAYGGRGMELSELIVFDGKLLTLDDRTGLIYEIQKNSVIPWVELNDGPGNSTKGFKAEWATVKNNLLWVGGHGTEWVNKAGQKVSDNPQWVKVVTAGGRVSLRPWQRKYHKLKRAAGIDRNGYITHEAANWSPVHKQWFFLPRKASNESYDDEKDEKRCTNLLFRANEKFTEVKVQHIGTRNEERGFSSFKFIPGSKDKVAVAIKAVEVGDKTESYIMVFNAVSGEVLLDELKIEDVKYEGIEFI